MSVYNYLSRTREIQHAVWLWDIDFSLWQCNVRMMGTTITITSTPATHIIIGPDRRTDGGECATLAAAATNVGLSVVCVFFYYIFMHNVLLVNALARA